MGLSQDEKNKLKLFSNLKLDRTQTETILCRQVTNQEWKSINKDYRKIFTPIARQAAKIAARKQQQQPPVTDTVQAQAIRANRYSKLYKSVAKEAAEAGFRKLFKTNIEDEKNKYHFVKSLFKQMKDEYTINKVQTHYNNKYRTTITDWKINGEVNLFNVNKVIRDLVQKITEGLPDNVRIQIVLKTSDDRQPDTKLLTI